MPVIVTLPISSSFFDIISFSMPRNSCYPLS